jgi:thiol-disulfide isomerase/thioredoxin|tara:strand:- start:77 stop:1564 length:1488 start_codon:yes stop_codon:yes gene_type:complete
MKYFRTVIPILFLIIYGCRYESESQKSDKFFSNEESVISGKIINSTDSINQRSLEISTDNFFNRYNKSTRLKVNIDKDGYFYFKTKFYHPQNSYFIFDEKYIQYYVKPGDSLHIEIDASKLNFENSQFVKFSGNNSITSALINDYRKENSNVLSHIMSASFFKNNPEDVIIDSIKNLEENLFKLNEKFILNNKCTEDFISWIDVNQKYNYAQLVLYYKMYSGKRNVTNQHFKPTHANGLINGDYKSFLINYSRGGFLRDSIFKALENNEKYFESRERAIDQFYQETEDPITRDLFSYRIYDDLVLFLSKEIKDTLVLSNIRESIGLNISNEVIKNLAFDRLSDINSEMLSVNIFNIDVSGNKSEKVVGNVLTQIKDKHKGNLIYLDIWATWCGPCRMQFPYAVKLKNQFSGEKISFVNLCLGNDFGIWKDIIKSYEFKNDNYYIAPKNISSYTEIFDVTKYPTYILIDEKGEIIDFDAPLPSDENIETVLSELLK